MERRMPRKYSSPVVKLASNSPKRTISFCISDPRRRRPAKQAAHELGRSRAVWLKLPRAEAPSIDVFLIAPGSAVRLCLEPSDLPGELIEVSDCWDCLRATFICSPPAPLFRPTPFRLTDLRPPVCQREYDFRVRAWGILLSAFILHI